MKIDKIIKAINNIDNENDLNMVQEAVNFELLKFEKPNTNLEDMKLKFEDFTNTLEDFLDDINKKDVR